MKKNINIMKVISVASGVLALAVEFIIQPKLDADEYEQMKEDNKKMIEAEVKRQLTLNK